MPNKDTIATVEGAVLKDLEKEKADIIQAKVSFTIKNTKPPNDSPTQSDQKTWKVLQTDTSIAILPADNTSSILYHKDYMAKSIDHMRYGPCQLQEKDLATKVRGKTNITSRLQDHWQ